MRPVEEVGLYSCCATPFFVHLTHLGQIAVAKQAAVAGILIQLVVHRT